MRQQNFYSWTLLYMKRDEQRSKRRKVIFPRQITSQKSKASARRLLQVSKRNQKKLQRRRKPAYIIETYAS